MLYDECSGGRVKIHERNEWGQAVTGRCDAPVRDIAD